MDKKLWNELSVTYTKCEYCNSGFPGNWKMKCTTCDTQYVICYDCNEKSAGKKWRMMCKICNRNKKIDKLI